MSNVSKQATRVFCLLILTNRKAEHKENERYTIRVINRKKKQHTNYASREMEFRNNFILSVISAISHKPFSNKLCLSSFSHRQDTTTVTGYSGVPLTKKYSSTKYTHRSYDYIISSGMPKKLTSSTDHKYGASSGSSLTENIILS